MIHDRSPAGLRACALALPWQIIQAAAPPGFPQDHREDHRQHRQPFPLSLPYPPLHPRHDPGTPATPPAFRLYRQRLPALSFCLVRSVIHTGSAAQYATMQPAARPPFWFRKHPAGSRSDFFSLIPEHSAGQIIEDRRRQDFRPAPYPLPPLVGSFRGPTPSPRCGAGIGFPQILNFEKSWSNHYNP